MRLYDNIELNEEVEELAKRGIRKGYDGVIVKWKEIFIPYVFTIPAISVRAFMQKFIKSI